MESNKPINEATFEEVETNLVKNICQRYGISTNNMYKLMNTLEPYIQAKGIDSAIELVRNVVNGVLLRQFDSPMIPESKITLRDILELIAESEDDDREVAIFTDSEDGKYGPCIKGYATHLLDFGVDQMNEIMRPILDAEVAYMALQEIEECNEYICIYLKMYNEGREG